MLPNKDHFISSGIEGSKKNDISSASFLLCLAGVWVTVFAAMPITPIYLYDGVSRHEINYKFINLLLPLVIHLSFIKPILDDALNARSSLEAFHSFHHLLDVIRVRFLFGVPLVPTLGGAKYYCPILYSAFVCLKRLAALLAVDGLRRNCLADFIVAIPLVSTLRGAKVCWIDSARISVMNLPAVVTRHGNLFGKFYWDFVSMLVLACGFIEIRLGFVCALDRAGKPSVYFALAALEWLAANLTRPCFPSRPGMRFKASLRAIFAFAVGGIRIGHHKLLAAIQTSLERVACGAAAFPRAKSKPILLGWWDLNGLAAVLALHGLHAANYTRRLFYCVQWEGK